MEDIVVIIASHVFYSVCIVSTVEVSSQPNVGETM